MNLCQTGIPSPRSELGDVFCLMPHGQGREWGRVCLSSSRSQLSSEQLAPGYLVLFQEEAA